MQTNINKIKFLPKNILDMKKDTDTFSFTVQKKIKSMYEQFKNNNENNKQISAKYSTDFNNIEYVLQIFELKNQNYQKDFEYYCNVLIKFYYGYHSPDTTPALKKLYFNLSNTIYKEMRESINQYFKFLQDVENPIAYQEKQRQLQKTQNKPKYIENTLDNGNYLPPMRFQEYNDVPRHRTKRGYEEII